MVPLATPWLPYHAAACKVCSPADMNASMSCFIALEATWMGLSPYALVQTRLWAPAFQCVRWHSTEQYATLPHCPHFFSFVAGSLLRQYAHAGRENQILAAAGYLQIRGNSVNHSAKACMASCLTPTSRTCDLALSICSICTYYGSIAVCPEKEVSLPGLGALEPCRITR